MVYWGLGCFTRMFKICKLKILLTPSITTRYKYITDFADFRDRTLSAGGGTGGFCGGHGIF